MEIRELKNTKYYSDVIEGLVTDKEKAIELLCQTSLAWSLLDESLKSDPEVIMYYQPLGHKDVLLSDNQDETDIGATISEVMAQKGFEAVFTFKLKEAGLISTTDGYGCYLSKPEINFPKGFDYETYFKIQNELSKNRLAVTISLETEARLFGFAHSDVSSIKSEKTTIYDRSLLSDIVSKYYVPTTGEAVKTIGTHPAM